MTTSPVSLWALLWSQQQGALHVEPLIDSLTKNRSAFARNMPGDYRILMVGDQDEVQALAQSCTQTMRSRFNRTKERQPCK